MRRAPFGVTRDCLRRELARVAARYGQLALVRRLVHANELTARVRDELMMLALWGAHRDVVFWLVKQRALVPTNATRTLALGSVSTDDIVAKADRAAALAAELVALNHARWVDSTVGPLDHAMAEFAERALKLGAPQQAIRLNLNPPPLQQVVARAHRVER